MLLRAGVVALSLTFAAPFAAQAQTIDFGAGGPQLDLRSKKQRQKDMYREQMARDQYRRDSYRYRDRDRDIPTGSVRRYDDRHDYGRRRGSW